VDLLPYGDADIELTQALETDPAVMAELGGPVAAGEIPAIHRRRLATTEGGGWWFVIVPEPGGPRVGTIGIWESETGGERIHEAGWMVLPAFQGRGIASEALGLLIERARAAPEYESVHAFPGLTNPASNALCRKFGFELVGELDGDYRGREFRVNHWRLGTEADG
jgi:RimJ/RimL family protein N-acetyltransferase